MIYRPYMHLIGETKCRLFSMYTERNKIIFLILSKTESNWYSVMVYRSYMHHIIYIYIHIYIYVWHPHMHRYVEIQNLTLQYMYVYKYVYTYINLYVWYIARISYHIYRGGRHGVPLFSIYHMYTKRNKILFLILSKTESNWIYNF